MSDLTSVQTFLQQMLIHFVLFRLIVPRDFAYNFEGKKKYFIIDLEI